MISPSRTSLVTAGVLAFLGCNSILDNQEGTLVAPDAGSSGSGETPSPGCPLDQHLCNGACVSLSDPLYGCGDPSCAPCPSTHSAMGCAGGACIVTSCDPGFANCNAADADGCEVDLSTPENCGACNATCGADAPKCAAAGASFECTTGCTPAAPLQCADACVDPDTSTNHCGGCNITCPAIPNSTSLCNLGVCAFTCKPEFHACDNRCPAKTDPTACGPDCVVCPVPPVGAATCTNDLCGFTCTAPTHACAGRCVSNDPTACGAACAACPAPPNATATCAAEVCGFACTAGFGNCDANPANGCEATFATDPLNCGTCGRFCAGLACVAGVCQIAL